MHDIIALIKTPVFWFTFVIVGLPSAVVANYISAKLHPAMDTALGKIFRTLSGTTERQRRARNARISRMVTDPTYMALRRQELLSAHFHFLFISVFCVLLMCWYGL